MSDQEASFLEHTQLQPGDQLAVVYDTDEILFIRPDRETVNLNAIRIRLNPATMCDHPPMAVTTRYVFEVICGLIAATHGLAIDLGIKTDSRLVFTLVERGA